MQPLAVGLIDSVPSILAYGAYGLAFLLMYLSYRLLRAVLDLKPPSQVYLLIILYLCLSLAFLVAAGYLQTRAVKISLVVQPWRDEAAVRASLGDSDLDLAGRGGKRPIQIRDNEAIVVDIYTMLEKLTDCRNLSTAQLQIAAKSSKEQGAANGL